MHSKIFTQFPFPGLQHNLLAHLHIEAKHFTTLSFLHTFLQVLNKQPLTFAYKSNHNSCQFTCMFHVNKASFATAFATSIYVLSHLF